MTKKQEEYWDIRVNKLFDEVYVEKEIKSIYSDALIYIQKELDILYDKLDDSIYVLTRTELYKLKSYTILLETIDIQMSLIKQDMLSTTVNQLTNGYKASVSLVYNLTKKTKPTKFINNKALQTALKKDWSGKHFSKRIWNNTDLLGTTIKDEITKTILTGESKDKAVEVIKNRMNVGFSSSDRLVRTELMSTMNQAQLDTYKDIGVKEFKYSAFLDSRTSIICRELNGKIFKIDEGKLGKNVPSLHPFAEALLYQY